MLQKINVSYIHVSMTDCYLMQQCVLLPSLMNPVWLLWLPSNEAAIWTPYGLCQLWTSFFSGDSQLLCSVEGVVRMAAWKCLPVALPVPLLKINTKTKTVFARLSENFRLLSKKIEVPSSNIWEKNLFFQWQKQASIFYKLWKLWITYRA